MDKVVSSIAGYGVPALVLMIAISATGYTGAAAITAALAALGGPFGMIVGINALVLGGIIVKAVSKYGIDAIFKAVVAELVRRGESRGSILEKIEGYPISRALKLMLIEQVNNAF